MQASDSGGDPPVSQALSITVDPEAPFSITSHSLGKASQNEYYQQVLGATGGNLAVHLGHHGRDFAGGPDPQLVR